MSVEIGLKDVDSLGLADPAMTVNIGIKDLALLGLTKVSVNQALRLHLLILLER